MTQIHTCYEVSKRLKEFLGDDCPSPEDMAYWWENNSDKSNCGVHKFPNALNRVGFTLYPAYRLEDLLSKPFFEAMENRIGNKDQNGELSMLACHYFDGGIEAVEKALCEMMEGK